MKRLSLLLVLALILVSALAAPTAAEPPPGPREDVAAVIVRVLDGGACIAVVPVLVRLDAVIAPDLARDWLAQRLPAGSVVTLRAMRRDASAESLVWAGVEDTQGDVASEMLRRGLVQPARGHPPPH